jgi:hypothetical protein
MPVHNTRAFDSLHILEGVSRIEGGHEVMASLDHVDAGEAVIGQAKTLGGQCASPKFKEQLASLKEFEDVVPHRPRLQVSISSCASLILKSM